MSLPRQTNHGKVFKMTGYSELQLRKDQGRAAVAFQKSLPKDAAKTIVASKRENGYSPKTSVDMIKPDKILKTGLTRRLIGDILLVDAKINHSVRHAGANSHIPLAAGGYNELAVMISFCHV